MKLQEKCECSCLFCKAACIKVPGWFLPNEIEKVANYLEMSSQEFFDKYLGVSWYTKRYFNIFVLAPLMEDMTEKEYPLIPEGKCVFFKDDRCLIHEVKPYECAITHHNDDYKLLSDRHCAVALEWDKPEYQKMIETFLGRKPVAKEFDLFSVLKTPPFNFSRFSKGKADISIEELRLKLSLKV